MPEPERLTVGPGLPFKLPEEPQHGPTLRGDLQVHGDGPAVRTTGSVGGTRDIVLHFSKTPFVFPLP